MYYEVAIQTELIK